mmetsp:Transcript_153503/g.268408  ORF Transcript_153503/g.268408 Transcript_153503/m.268408 type:complete len:222 (+) Transcript_153503:3641-4306(+)
MYFISITLIYKDLLRPLSTQQLFLDSQGELHCCRNVMERQHERIAFGLHLIAVVRWQQGAENVVVHAEGLAHGLRLLVPQVGAVLHICENERHQPDRGLDFAAKFHQPAGGPRANLGNQTQSRSQLPFKSLLVVATGADGATFVAIHPTTLVLGVGIIHFRLGQSPYIHLFAENTKSPLRGGHGLHGLGWRLGHHSLAARASGREGCSGLVEAAVHGDSVF